MKVAIVIPDGLSVLLFCKGIINALKKHNNKMDICVISSDGIYKKEIEELGIKSISVEMYRFFNPIKDFICLVSLYRIFRREKFDLVINFSTKPNIYGTIAAKLAHVKKIVSHVVGLGTAFSSEKGIKIRLMQVVFLKLYHLACKLSDKVWFTNEDNLRFFVSQYLVGQKKTILTKNYLDTDYYSIKTVSSDELADLRKEFNLDQHDKIVVMVARMIWPKGIGEFAEAAELLKDKYSYLKFLLIAPLENGNPDAVPEAYIKEKEKTSNLRWLGFRHDVKNIYALSDLAVLPSYYQEGGFPRGLLEPMAMGKPIIATDSVHCRGPVEEGKNGYLVPVKDSRALANAIEILINDDNKRREFGDYSRLKAEKDFDEKVILQKVVKEIV